MRKNDEKEKHIFNGIFSQIKKRSWRKNDFKKMLQEMMQVLEMTKQMI